MDRRGFVKSSAAVAAGVTLFGPDFWRSALAAVDPGPGPYGALGVVDANGIQLPAGFTSRIIATSGQVVGPTSYVWHILPDGGACYPVPGGGWIYACNSEGGGGTGGVSAVKFNPAGGVVDAYRILAGTTANCSGGPTPWGTWLSCEESLVGHVWECNPQAPGQGIERPLLGTFVHEAAAVDPATGIVYLTEDRFDGRLYRFVPTTYGVLTAGQLQAAKIGTDGTSVTWVNVASDVPAPRDDAATAAFNRGEGAWTGPGVLYFCTTADFKIWELTFATQKIRVFYDGNANAGFPLHWPDNITVHTQSGDIFVCEDGDNMELCVIGTVGGVSQVAVFARWPGHLASELAGVAFSPDGSRLYISSQRGAEGANGITYEISGPFRTVFTPGAASQFVPVAPRRLLDTRNTTKPVAGSTTDVQVTGADIPTNATAAILNITGTEATADGFLTAFPTGETRPLAANQNLVTNRTRGNLVAAKIGTGGKISVYSQSGTHLVADVFGYFVQPPPISTSGRFTPIAPDRLFDSRATGKLPAGGTVDVQVTGAAGIPATGVSSVVVNITITNPDGPGFVTGFATGADRPTTSNVNNDRAGQTIGNLAVLPVGIGGRIRLFTFAAADVVVDVAGWFSDGSGPATSKGLFVPVRPIRFLDTREQPGGLKIASGGEWQQTVAGSFSGGPPADAAGVLINVTMVDVERPGFVSVYPTGTARRVASSVYADRAGMIIPNLVASQVGEAGRITFFANEATHLVVDLAGWFTA